MASPLLVAQALHKAYRMGSDRLQVLRGCSLRLEAGEFVAVMGKSGSGKSTLLHLLGALDVPDSGQVAFDGETIVQAEPKRGTPGASLLRVLAWATWIIVLPGILLSSLLFLVLPLVLGSFVLAGALFLICVISGVQMFITNLNERERVQMRRRQVGFVFQFYHLLPELNVLENVLITRQVGCSLLEWLSRRTEARREAIDVLTRVGLAQRLKHRPSELSGGEQQRVAIARALIHKPRILFADEPTGHLDAEAGAKLMALFAELHREGQTIVMVTHDPGIAQHADRTLLLHDGALRAE